MVTSRGRTRVALLRLALCYSVVPLRSAHKPIPYGDSKRICQSYQFVIIVSQCLVTYAAFFLGVAYRASVRMFIVDGLPHSLLPSEEMKRIRHANSRKPNALVARQLTLI